MGVESWAGVIVCSVAAVAVGLLVARTRASPGRATGLFLLAVWAVAVLGVTVLPAVVQGADGYVEPLPWNIVKLVPLQTVVGQLDDLGLLVRQSGGNIVMFVPLGVLVPMLWPRWRRWPRGFVATVAVGAALSLAIELTQLALLFAQFGAPRVADVSDVILNATGTAVGWAVFRTLRSRSTPWLLWVLDRVGRPA